MRHIVALMIAFSIIYACQSSVVNNKYSVKDEKNVELIILGTIQDAGSPQIGCNKSCCVTLWEHPDPTRMISCIGIRDHADNKNFLIDGTPDIKNQLNLLLNKVDSSKSVPDGIFLTHAHMGHYTGLMQLGKEALGAQKVKVYAMPKMSNFLNSNGPWDQLVKEKNIIVTSLTADSTIALTKSVAVTPILVPHRDEYSETVGYKIKGPNKSALFIPDIDKWHIWERSIIAEIAKVDYAFLDATFFDGNELGGRDMSLIPHPFVVESMALFSQLSDQEKSKIHFIHLNHTNPLLDLKSKEYDLVKSAGFQIARFGQSISL